MPRLLCRHTAPKHESFKVALSQTTLSGTPYNGDDVIRTIFDAASAYDKLKMELRDFDLVYAYP